MEETMVHLIIKSNQIKPVFQKTTPNTFGSANKFWLPDPESGWIDLNWYFLSCCLPFFPHVVQIIEKDFTFYFDSNS